MARILAALKQVTANRGSPTNAVAAPRPYRPSENVETPTEPDEEVPYIEVGDKSKPIDASADVLARPVPTRVPLPKLAAPEPVATRGVEIVTLMPKAAAVCLQPIPPQPAALKPPLERFAPELLALHDPNHPMVSQYRAIHAAVTSQLPAARSQVVMCSAAASGVGTTTVVLNLALMAVQQGKPRVVVVDANLRRPAVAERLGLPLVPGLAEVLAGKISLPRALQETGYANLLTLVAGDITCCGSARLAGDAMRSVVRHLRQRFEMVLIDAPCWDGRPEVVALGTACDALYLVLPQAAADRQDVKDLLEVIPQQGAPLRGCILTQR